MSKYHAKQTECRERWLHASKHEANRCNELHLLQRADEIELLMAHPQVRYQLTVGEHLIATYVADFTYIDKRKGCFVVEDAKGVRTKDYVIKRKLMLACLGIKITEV